MMKIEDTKLEGVKIIYGDRFSDERGYFQETCRDSLLHKLLEDGQKFI